jgi:hypothetical protein
MHSNPANPATGAGTANPLHTPPAAPTAASNLTHPPVTSNGANHPPVTPNGKLQPASNGKPQQTARLAKKPPPKPPAKPKPEDNKERQ